MRFFPSTFFIRHFAGGLALVLVGCSSATKNWTKLPSLPESTPVTIFDREPNVKFDRVCEIEMTNRFATTSPGQIAQELKSEARKCGADGVIMYNRVLSAAAGESTWATAIKIRSHEAGFVSPENVSAFSLAIQRHDLNRVRELLQNVPKLQKDRAPSDDTLVNLGLYVATLDGLRCSAKIVGLLEIEYEAKVTKFGAVQVPSPTRTDSQTPLCLDVMARSLAGMENPASAVLTVNNYYVDLLANYNGADLESRVAAYNQILRESSKLIVAACKRSKDDPMCLLRTSFVDFSQKTKDIKSRALKRNAIDVLKILRAELTATFPSHAERKIHES